MSATDTDESTSVTTADTPLEIRPDRKVIFINLVVLDASNAIDQQLGKKLQGYPVALQKVATKVATSLATPERVAQALAGELPKKLVEKMSSKGLTAAAELVFLEGPYVVLQLQILSVSPQAMIEAQSKDFYDEDGLLEDSATLSQDWAAMIQGWLAKFLDFIGVHRTKSLQDEYLPTLIQAKMETVMNDIMAGKLESKGLEAMSQVLPEEKQGRFFFTTLKELRQVKEEMKPKYKVASAVAKAKANVQAKAATIKAGAKSSLSKLKPKLPPKPKFPGKKVE